MRGEWAYRRRHFQVRLRPDPYLNIPYWPHRIIVIARGHLTRNGRYIGWLPGIFPLTLHNCCPGRVK